MSDQYKNQQQKIDELEGIHGECREPFMNDEAYLAKLQSLEVPPKKTIMKILEGKKKKS